MEGGECQTFSFPLGHFPTGRATQGLPLSVVACPSLRCAELTTGSRGQRATAVSNPLPTPSYGSPKLCPVHVWEYLLSTKKIVCEYLLSAKKIKVQSWNSQAGMGGTP